MPQGIAGRLNICIRLILNFLFIIVILLASYTKHVRAAKWETMKLIHVFQKYLYT